MSTPIDTLCAAQDTLLERLISGRITARNLRAAYRLHIYTLTRANFTQREAVDCFWDAVATAGHTRRHERSAAA